MERGFNSVNKMKTLPKPPFSVRVENNEEWNKIAPMLEADGYTWWSSGELPTKEEPMEYPDYIDCFGNKEIAAEGLDVPEFDIFDPNPFHLTHPSDLIPAYQTSGSAGFDIACNQDIELRPMKRMLVSTGIFVHNMPADTELQIRPRSGNAFKHGITVLNSPGTVDADFALEVKVLLINLGEDTFRCKRGERIAQGVFSKVERPACIPVLTNERIGGFGSTNEQTGPIVEGISTNDKG
jgi:dUTP pyrophosphatase